MSHHDNHTPEDIARMRTFLTAEGGPVRWAASCPAQEEALHAVPHQPVRVCGGTVRYTNSDEAAAETGGTSRHTISSAGTAGASALSTLDRFGPHQSVELEPGNPASRTDVQTAVRLGILRETSPGIFEEVGRGLRPGSEAEAPNADLPVEAATKPEDHFDAEDSQALDDAIAPIAQPVWDAAIGMGISTMLRGETVEDLGKVALRLASDAAMAPSDAAELVHHTYALHEGAVARAVAPLGITGECQAAFYAWAGQQLSLAESVQKLVHMRDVSGFMQLAREFKREHPGDLSAYHAAGFETHVDRNGDVLLKRPGGQWRKLAELSGA